MKVIDIGAATVCCSLRRIEPVFSRSVDGVAWITYPVDGEPAQFALERLARGG